MLDKDSRLFIMPDADSFLVWCWFKLNLCCVNGGTRSPLTYSEIESFNNLRQADLKPEDAELLVSMSTTYINAKHKYDDNNVDYPPYIESEESKQEFKQFRRKLVNAKINSM